MSSHWLLNASAHWRMLSLMEIMDYLIGDSVLTYLVGEQLAALLPDGYQFEDFQVDCEGLFKLP